MKKVLIFISIFISLIYLSGAINITLNSGAKLDNSNWNNLSSILNKVDISGGDININGKLAVDGKICDNTGKCLGNKTGTETNPGTSCKTILEDDSSSVSKTYYIDPNGGNSSDKFQVYCDMTTDGGGWTQIHFSAQDTESTKINYSEIFSEESMGNFGSGSYTIKARELLTNATKFRYSQTNNNALLNSKTPSWEHDFYCNINSEIRTKYLNPGNGLGSQLPSSINCYNIKTGTKSSGATLTNYILRGSGRDRPRLWIGNNQHDGNYHGNYAVDGFATWKHQGSNHKAVYSGITSTGYSESVMTFWLK